MKDHQIAALVNTLRDIAVEFHGAQQLRERISQAVCAALHSDAEQAPVAWQVRRADGRIDGAPIQWENCTAELYKATLSTGRYAGCENGPRCEVRALYVAPAAPMVGSWQWLRCVIEGIPGRSEPVCGQPVSYVQRSAVLNWIDEGERRASISTGVPAAAAPTPADWRGDFERKALVGGFDLSREEWGDGYSHPGSARAWLWYYSGRLDGECGVATTPIAPGAAAQGEAGKKA